MITGGQAVVKHTAVAAGDVRRQAERKAMAVWRQSVVAMKVVLPAVIGWRQVDRRTCRRNRGRSSPVVEGRAAVTALRLAGVKQGRGAAGGRSRGRRIIGGGQRTWVASGPLRSGCKVVVVAENPLERPNVLHRMFQDVHLEITINFKTLPI
jgi:hypothetical protein